MFGKYFIRRDLNISIIQELALLPTIIFYKTGKYFECNIKFLCINVYIVWSLGNFEKDES